MRMLIGAATLVLLGVSPWIPPSLPVAAAKMTRDEARGACGGELVQRRPGDGDHAGVRRGPATQDCVDAKLSSRTWPWS